MRSQMKSLGTSPRKSCAGRVDKMTNDHPLLLCNEFMTEPAHWTAGAPLALAEVPLRVETITGRRARACGASRLARRPLRRYPHRERSRDAP